MKIRKIVTIAIMISLSTILSIVESFIPTGIPGVKLGLANVVTLILIYMYSPKEACIEHFLRIFLVGLIYTGILSQAFLLSLAGGLLSFILMTVCYLINKKAIFITSLMGAIFHSIGQIILASFILKSSAVIYYLPIIFTLSIPCGILTAFISKIVLNNLKIEVNKPKISVLIATSLVFLILLSLVIVSFSYKRSTKEGAIATITNENRDILKIPLDNPSEYVSYCNNLIECKEEDGSYLFTLAIYNNDEKDVFNVIIEVKDKAIRIKDETCKKHICSNRGYIKTKYESIICLPNSLIITIHDYELNNIDTMM